MHVGMLPFYTQFIVMHTLTSFFSFSFLHTCRCTYARAARYTTQPKAVVSDCSQAVEVLDLGTKLSDATETEEAEYEIRRIARGSAVFINPTPGTVFHVSWCSFMMVLAHS